MQEKQVRRMADILVTYSIAARPGDWVVIQAASQAEPLAVACLEAVVRAGANPSLLIEPEGSQAALMRHGDDAQLAFLSPVSRIIAEQADAAIQIATYGEIAEAQQADPSRAALRRRALAPLTRVINRRVANGTLRRATTQYPTEAAARAAGMSPQEYDEFVCRAAFLDRPDPVAAWWELSRRQQALIDWLQDRSTIRVTSPGTDLTVSVAGRHWVNSDGHRNFPSGEIFTGPLEGATQGTIAFNLPSQTRGGAADGVRLVFERGEVVKATAAAGEEFLQRMLGLDGGARRLGEFAFGTHPSIRRFTRNTLFDEKMGGTLHMALGQAYPETGGTNESILHWDMVHDLRQGAEVFVDGQLFSKDGEFQV